MKKVLYLLVLYGAILLVAFHYKDFLLDWLYDSDFSQLPFMFFLSVFLSVIPIIPFTIFAGMMGVKYGIWVGGLINWFGNVGASVIFFLLARYFFTDVFKQYVSRFKGYEKWNRILNKNSFFTVLFARLIIIVPAPVINIGSALSSISFKAYFLATALGEVPSMIIYALLGNQLVISVRTFMYILSLYLGFIIVIWLIYRRWLKQKSKVVQ